MSTRTIHINTASPQPPRAAVLIIYTGGTLGMIYDASEVLVPFNFEHVLDKIPALKALALEITVVPFSPLLDSSDMGPSSWVDIGRIIYENHEKYDGFVVLHGTDTMAYSAAALSYMLKDFNKPVIFTGAQLPIEALRSDARNNLLTALEIAAIKEKGRPVVPEVCIYFNNLLLRANRSKKVESLHFDAFKSENYPPLAEVGIMIDFNKKRIRPFMPERPFVFCDTFDNNVAILKLFPGISRQVVENIFLIPSLKGVVMETFGSGNAPTAPWFIDILARAIQQDILILNVSQCNGGRVMQGKYKTSKALKDIGVLSGADITTEAAVTKMMFLLGTEKNRDRVKKKLVRSLSGEMTVL